jgi:hypothetical protein
MTIRTRYATPLLCLALAIQSLVGVSFAAMPEFTGSLECVTPHTVFIRLNDGRIVEGLLRGTEPETLAAKYKIGDQMKFRYSEITPTWVGEEHDFRRSEVSEIQFLRDPSPEELKAALASRASSRSDNLLKRPEVGPIAANLHLNGLKLPTGSDSDTDPGESVPGLSQLQAAATAYVSSLPNYVADETATEFSSPAAPLAWRKANVLQSEVTFTGSRDTRQHPMFDGKPWEGDLMAIPMHKPTGGFSDTLRAIFKKSCAITFDLKGRTTESSKQLLVYGFMTPPDGCLPPQGEEHLGEIYYPGYSGQIVFDPALKAIMRVETQTTGFPKPMNLALVEERISWGFVTIGEASHLLPISAQRLKVTRSGAILIKQEYKNHRHFESSTNITFDK